MALLWPLSLFTPTVPGPTVPITLTSYVPHGPTVPGPTVPIHPP